jgi:hypothetical protein
VEKDRREDHHPGLITGAGQSHKATKNSLFFPSKLRALVTSWLKALDVPVNPEATSR